LNFLRENILQLLDDHGTEGKFPVLMEQLAEKYGPAAFGVLFNVLTSLSGSQFSAISAR
jgi:hypothetical protein